MHAASIILEIYWIEYFKIVLLIARIRPLFANPVTYISGTFYSKKITFKAISILLWLGNLKSSLTCSEEIPGEETSLPLAISVGYLTLFEG